MSEVCTGVEDKQYDNGLSDARFEKYTFYMDKSQGVQDTWHSGRMDVNHNTKSGPIAYKWVWS